MRSERSEGHETDCRHDRLVTKQVVVLDYGFGNVRSAVRALERAGASVELTADRSAASEADGLVEMDAYQASAPRAVVGRHAEVGRVRSLTLAVQRAT